MIVRKSNSKPGGVDDMRSGLRGAVERFRSAHPGLPGLPGLDKHDLAVLDRLSEEKWEKHVLPAFEAVGFGRWAQLIQDCVRAGRIGRSREEHELKQDAKRHQESVKKLKEIEAALRTITKSFDCALPPYSAALEVFRLGLCDMQRDAEEIRLRRSRNTNLDARRSTAYGWLRESIRRRAPNAPYKLVADLAMAVLDLEEEPRDNAIRLAKTPQQRRREAEDRPAQVDKATATPTAAASRPPIMPDGLTCEVQPHGAIIEVHKQDPDGRSVSRFFGADNVHFVQAFSPRSTLRKIKSIRTGGDGG